MFERASSADYQKILLNFYIMLFKEFGQFFAFCFADPKNESDVYILATILSTCWFESGALPSRMCKIPPFTQTAFLSYV